MPALYGNNYISIKEGVSLIYFKKIINWCLLKLLSVYLTNNGIKRFVQLCFVLVKNLDLKENMRKEYYSIDDKTVQWFTIYRHLAMITQ